MSATRLLVLALVRAHKRAHGYLVGQELLAWDADKWANTKTGSIYHALRQLTKEGLLKATEVDAEEGQISRTDYEITPSGEKEFHTLMERALVTPDPRPDMLCAGLVLMPALPRAKVLEYLRRRLDILDEQRASVHQAVDKARWTGADALPPHVEAILGFWTHSTNSSHEWVLGMIRKIEDGAYVFVDEDPRAFASPGSRMARSSQA